DANRRHCFQHKHRVIRSKSFKYRSTDACVWENREKGGVRAADAIACIDGRDGTHHSFEQLGRESTLTASLQHALTHVPEVSLHLPNRPSGYQSTDKKRNPDPN